MENKKILCLCKGEKKEKIETFFIIEGYEVEIIDDKEKIKEICEKENIKCLFIDFSLINQDWETIKYIRTFYKGPLILWIQKSTPEIAVKAIKEGVQGILEEKRTDYEIQKNLEKILDVIENFS